MPFPCDSVWSLVYDVLLKFNFDLWNAIKLDIYPVDVCGYINRERISNRDIVTRNFDIIFQHDVEPACNAIFAYGCLRRGCLRRGCLFNNLTFFISWIQFRVFAARTKPIGYSLQSYFKFFLKKHHRRQQTNVLSKNVPNDYRMCRDDAGRSLLKLNAGLLTCSHGRTVLLFNRPYLFQYISPNLLTPRVFRFDINK